MTSVEAGRHSFNESKVHRDRDGQYTHGGGDVKASRRPRAAAVPKLTTVPGVPLAFTGTWSASTGSWTPTRQDFVAAVAARECPAVQAPIIKLGHVDTRFDGQPAIGRIGNLRVADGGHTLLGDYEGVPAWIAEKTGDGHSVLSSAYPQRSVEATYRYRCAAGHTHPFVITALALLGTTPPAVGALTSLADVGRLYGVDVAAANADHGGQKVVATVDVEAATGDGNADRLLKYWTTGPGALKIRWRSDGDFTRCVKELRGKVRDPKGLCATYHKVATGLWPGDKRNLAASTHPDDGSIMPAPSAVEVADGLTADALREAYYASAPTDSWIAEIHPDQLIITGADRRFRRVPFTVAAGKPRFAEPIPVRPAYEDETVAASALLVYASAAESRPGGLGQAAADNAAQAAQDAVERLTDGPPPPVEPPVFQPPVEAPAEPAGDPAAPEPPPEPPAEPETPPIEEEEMALSADALGALGLKFGADDKAISAAIVALAKKADKGEKVAASAEQQEAAQREIAAAAAQNAELSAKVGLLTEQVETLSAHVASVNAEKASTVKASVIGDALKSGRISPAQQDQWSARYDQAPEVVTEVLASIAPGTAVPVLASGYTGEAEPANNGIDAEYERLFSTTGTGA